jgi:hypothetical protein
MKKYRITFRPVELDGRPEKVEEVYADTWRVDSDAVVLVRREGDTEVTVFDVPKTNVRRIVEI